MKELVALLAVSIVVGSAAGLALSQDRLEPVLETFSGEEKEKDNTGSFKLGSAHEHALFYVVVDGEKLNFTGERYQLAASYVHLENDRSHIVHKHAENVTWGDFFETIDMKVNSSDQEVCLEVKDISRCGEGEIYLDNSTGNYAQQEIMQNHKFLLTLGENSTAEMERLQEFEVPENYRPRNARGRRL